MSTVPRRTPRPGPRPGRATGRRYLRCPQPQQEALTATAEDRSPGPAASAGCRPKAAGCRPHQDGSHEHPRSSRNRGGSTRSPAAPASAVPSSASSMAARAAALIRRDTRERGQRPTRYASSGCRATGPRKISGHQLPPFAAWRQARFSSGTNMFMIATARKAPRPAPVDRSRKPAAAAGPNAKRRSGESESPGRWP